MALKQFTKHQIAYLQYTKGLFQVLRQKNFKKKEETNH